jgi:hypothetical protein
MSLATIATESLGSFALRPVEGQPNTSIIRLKLNRNRRAAPKRGATLRSKMTDEDWDKFEKDIVDAFEQVP